MIFFNNSCYRGYVCGNVIKTNLIYKLTDFEEILVPHIRKTILNTEIILILNKMFTPITGNDPNYPYECDTYNKVMFDHVKGDGCILYNNDKYIANDFIDLYKSYSFTKNDVILFEDCIEYHEEFIKDTDNVKNANTDNI